MIDELAQETKRATLLERVEAQFEGKTVVSRLLFGFQINDDRQLHNKLEQEFATWRKKDERYAEELTGVLIFSPVGAVQLLEGPSDVLFEAVIFFNTLTPAVIGPLRVLHFTELQGVRTTVAWTALHHSGKAPGGAGAPQVDENACTDLVAKVYQKILAMNTSVKDIVMASEDTIEHDHLLKKAMDVDGPSVEDISVLMGKGTGDFLFSFEEFSKVFIEPFSLKLHSEVLWPMPPALVY